MKVRKENNTYDRNRDGSNVGDKWTEDSNQDLLNRVRDYGYKDDRDISTMFYGKEFTQACAQWEEPTWKPGKLPHAGGDSTPRYGAKGYHTTHQRGPDDMTNSAGSAVKPGDNRYFAKKPGRAGNQRSGA